MTRPIQVLLRELKSGLTALYGDRLKGVYLYGSYARDEADAESDVDILVVLDRIDHYAGEIRRTGHLGATLSLKYGVSLSHVYLSEEQWRHGDTGFLANVRDEAIAA